MHTVLVLGSSDITAVFPEKKNITQPITDDDLAASLSELRTKHHVRSAVVCVDPTWLYTTYTKAKRSKVVRNSLKELFPIAPADLIVHIEKLKDGSAVMAMNKQKFTDVLQALKTAKIHCSGITTESAACAATSKKDCIQVTSCTSCISVAVVSRGMIVDEDILPAKAGEKAIARAVQQLSTEFEEYSVRVFGPKSIADALKPEKPKKSKKKKDEKESEQPTLRIEHVSAKENGVTYAAKGKGLLPLRLPMQHKAIKYTLLLFSLLVIATAITYGILRLNGYIVTISFDPLMEFIENL